MPASIPLVQCTPVKNGFSLHHERSCSCGHLGVVLVLRQPPSGSQHSNVMMPRHLPDLFDVARLCLVSMVDLERQLAVGRAAPGHRVMEPVRLSAVRARSTKNTPPSGQDRVSCPHDGGSVFRCHADAGRCRQRRHKGTLVSDVPRKSGRLTGLDLATCPAPAASRIQRSVGHLGLPTFRGVVGYTSRARDGSPNHRLVG